MIASVCVFCSSSEDLNVSFYNEAKVLGSILGSNNYQLIHGGGIIGLMGVLLKSAYDNGSNVVGVVPERLNRSNIVSSEFQTLVITTDMKERKEYMRVNSDAFIALPGGFGTLEELVEVITLKQLKYHSKPIVIINYDNYYDNLLKQFEVSFIQKFANESYRDLYYVAVDSQDAINYIQNYEPKNIYDKYLKE